VIDMKTASRLRAILVTVTAIGALTARAEANHESDVVIEWNQLLQANIPSSAGVLTPRYYAMLHIAIFDAVNSNRRVYTPYRARVFAPYGASAEAAAAQAAHDILVALIPSAQPAFDAALQARLASIPPSRALPGAVLGRKVALEILAWRQNDGSAAPAPAYVLPALPGLWQPTPPGFQPPSFPQFGDVTPFALLTATQYLPRRPPTLTSDEYTADFEEVKLLGSAGSTARTTEQTQLARLFAPAGYRTQHWAVWNNVARDVARSRSWSLVDTARLFALMNAAIHDGLQTSHTSKFVYGLWRPVTAIQRADEDLNPLTLADVAWTPLITTPPYPSHSSNQTCVGASAARALALALESDAMPFAVTWLGTTGNADVTRSYTGFWQLADDQARSRIYAGIHFTFELTASQVSCIAVADYVFDNYMLPRDHRHYFD
jgi:hypothetical protein